LKAGYARRHALSGGCQYVIGQQVWFYEKPGELIDRRQAARKAEHSDIIIVLCWLGVISN